jgi:competence ComEA-like helix-hairpin-helix protein
VGRFRTPSFVLGLAAAALVGSTLVAARQVDQSAPPPAAPTAADDPRAPLFFEMCGECHDGERIVSKRRTKADWQDVLRKMIEEGALGTEKDFQTVFEYLLLYYGRVYVNEARADDLAMTLGLSKKDAEAIVAFRTKNGPFADFDALRKVPEIDLKTLDQHKDAAAF